MSQFGMQMPASRSRRGSSMDAATVIAGVAVLCLVAACFVMWQAGSRVAPDGQWWNLQKAGSIKITTPAGSPAPAPAPRPAGK